MLVKDGVITHNIKTQANVDAPGFILTLDTSKRKMKKEKGCGKKKYQSEDDVIFVGREQVFIYWATEQLYYYYCDECDAWHLTSKPTENKII